MWMTHSHTRALFLALAALSLSGCMLFPEGIEMEPEPPEPQATSQGVDSESMVAPTYGQGDESPAWNGDDVNGPPQGEGEGSGVWSPPEPFSPDLDEDGDDVTPSPGLEGCHAMPEGDVILDVDTFAGYELHHRIGEGSGPVGLHVLSVYETDSSRGFREHPEGDASVRVELPGEHDLVLVSYEPVHWTLDVAPGTTVRSVKVYGYHEQRVTAPVGTTVDIASYQGGTGAGVYCGYSLPYNGGGCDTDALLEEIERSAGRAISSFHGTYVASEFLLSGAACEPQVGCDGWEPSSFVRPADLTSGRYGQDVLDITCDGEQFKRYDGAQDLWVGLTACEEGGYRFYLSNARDGDYLPATDTAGHGQDFCELVDPTFTLGHEDDITSGNCSACDTGRNVPLEGMEVYSRANLGQQFTRATSGAWSYQTSIVTCATGPLECAQR